MNDAITCGTIWIASLFLFLTGCTVDAPVASNPAIVDVTFAMRPLDAMNGKITVHEAYLKLDRIEVSGMLGGKVNAAMTHSIPPEEPPFKLSQADSSHVTLTVPARDYDHLGLRLFPANQAYELVLLGNAGAEETPSPPPPQNADDHDNGNPGNSDTDQDEDDDVDSGQDNVDDDQSENEEPSEEEQNDDGGQENGDNDDDRQQDEDEDDGSDNQDRNEDDEDHGDENDKQDKRDKKDRKNKENKKDNDDGKNDKHHKDDDDRDDHQGHGHNDDDDKHDGDDQDDGDDDDEKGRTTADAPGQAVDLDNFFQNAKPGLVIFATYENNGKTISLIFASTDLEKIAITATQNDITSIRLTEQNEAHITFDPGKLFGQVSPADLEAGRTQRYQQQEVLFIHPRHNAELYEVIISGVEGSAHLELSPAASP